MNTILLSEITMTYMLFQMQIPEFRICHLVYGRQSTLDTIDSSEPTKNVHMCFITLNTGNFFWSTAARLKRWGVDDVAAGLDIITCSWNYCLWQVIRATACICVVASIHK